MNYLKLYSILISFFIFMNWLPFDARTKIKERIFSHEVNLDGKH